MIRSIILWLVRWLNENLDSTLAADIAAYEQKVRELDVRANERAALLAQLEGDNAAREKAIAREQQRRLELDSRLSNEMALADALERQLHEVLAKIKPAADIPAIDRDL